MLANDIEERWIRKALFVSTNRGGSVDAREDCRLSRRALRTTGNAQAGIGRRQDTVERYLRRLMLKDRQRFGLNQAIKWVVRAARAYAQTVDKKKEQRGLTISHPCRAAIPACGIHSTCVKRFQTDV